MISIHALREEGDAGHGARHGGQPISIHALREEGDAAFFSASSFSIKFLSTPSARRATCQVFWLSLELEISIHALREEGDVVIPDPAPVPAKISIHALREEGDGAVFVDVGLHVKFLSTPSARRATLITKNINAMTFISIHALREEGDNKRILSDEFRT